MFSSRAGSERKRPMNQLRGKVTPCKVPGSNGAAGTVALAVKVERMRWRLRRSGRRLGKRNEGLDGVMVSGECEGGTDQQYE